MEELKELDLAVIAPFIIIQLVLMIVGLIAWFKTDETNGPKWMWLLIIVFGSMLGPILFFIVGRRQN
ncbi:PLD nuclease N-terminal domain-containing protein [Aquibacillus koreensis]|uniref:PLD nuclease N-terminal domain-containing protein n=1 Tax=Aquibacillus koreensis TaxID=279446 RepID=A0A9X3WQF0_9BACI|nr:PLD nuclease N-terminal domain-containing protein [Aquibacillus koreensis]MCT2534404.1 PLD nuclease N-terminal domain-containing protein [Aquibacillus koreensis]MDC3421711.1 PLD nuclease N-terminal domain-containing protein [Aquibacillus koreensis]